MQMKGTCLFLCLLFSWVTWCSGTGEFRKFTSTEGTVIRAELLAASNLVVSLRRDDGVIFKDVPLQRFSEYDRHYIEVWISKLREPERQSLYRVEAGGCRPVCNDYHGRGSRYIIDASGGVVVVPGQWQCRSCWMPQGIYQQGFRHKVQIYESDDSRVVIVTRP